MGGGRCELGIILALLAYLSRSKHHNQSKARRANGHTYNEHEPSAFARTFNQEESTELSRYSRFSTTRHLGVL